MRRIYFCLSAVTAVLIQGCAYNQMTYFRKHGASMAEERRDWGLCGGDFYANGQLRPVVDQSILNCMSEKGYQTLNDYYVEQRIGFVSRNNPDSDFMTADMYKTCQFSSLPERDNKLCSHERFVLKSRLPAIIRCVSAFGFEPTIPSQGNAFRIVDNYNTLPRNFCLSLTPRAGKGGVSLGQWRWE